MCTWWLWEAPRGPKSIFSRSNFTKNIFAKNRRCHRVRYPKARFLWKFDILNYFLSTLNLEFSWFWTYLWRIWDCGRFSTLESLQTKILACGFFSKLCNFFSRFVTKFERLNAVCVASRSILRSNFDPFATCSTVHSQNWSWKCLTNLTSWVWKLIFGGESDMMLFLLMDSQKRQKWPVWSITQCLSRLVCSIWGPKTPETVLPLKIWQNRPKFFPSVREFFSA